MELELYVIPGKDGETLARAIARKRQELEMHEQGERTDKTERQEREEHDSDQEGDG